MGTSASSVAAAAGSAGGAASGAGAGGSGLGRPRYSESERSFYDKMRGEGAMDEGNLDLPEPDLQPEGGGVATLEGEDGEDDAQDAFGADEGDEEGAENPADEAAQAAEGEADPLDGLLSQTDTLLAVAALAQRGVSKATIAKLLKDPEALAEMARTLGGGTDSASPASPQTADAGAELDKVLAGPLKELVDVFGDEETAGKMAGPLKAVATHAIKQARAQAMAEIAPIKKNLGFMVEQVETMMFDLSAQSLAAQFKQLGTPAGQKQVREKMLTLAKTKRYQTMGEMMKDAAGLVFGQAKKQDIQREMADKSRAKTLGQPTSPSQAAKAQPLSSAPRTRDEYDRAIFVMKEDGVSAEKIARYKQKYSGIVTKGRLPR